MVKDGSITQYSLAQAKAANTLPLSFIRNTQFSNPPPSSCAYCSPSPPHTPYAFNHAPTVSLPASPGQIKLEKQKSENLEQTGKLVTLVVISNQAEFSSPQAGEESVLALHITKYKIKC